MEFVCLDQNRSQRLFVFFCKKHLRFVWIGLGDWRDGPGRAALRFLILASLVGDVAANFTFYLGLVLCRPSRTTNTRDLLLLC